MKILISLFILMVCLTLEVFGQNKALSSQLDSLVNSERAFARTCVEKGLRASFIEFFADDGISFTPHPVNTKEDLRKRPEPSAPPSSTLNWEPVFADISLAGDLGYTTGPVVSTDNAKKQSPRYAYYFSIWKKQRDGNWRVLIDYGIGTPTPADSSSTNSFKAATPVRWKTSQQVDGERERAALMNVERKLSGDTAAGNVAQNFSRYLMDESRMHRDGLMPVLSKRAILAFINEQQLKKVTFEPIGAGVADSGDLGYTYGKYELQKKDPSAGIEKGYVVRVWKRNSHGDWKIVADVANALPRESAIPILP